MTSDDTANSYHEEVRTEREVIELRFEGDLFEHHDVPAELYAESLLAFARLVKRSDTLASKNPRDVQVKVTAIGQGSFITTLALEVPGLLEHAKHLLTGSETTTVINASALIGIVFAAVKALKKYGSQLATVVVNTQSRVALLKTFDGGEFEVQYEVGLLLNDSRWRNRADEFTSPLEDEGVDDLTISHGDDEIGISREDRDAFAYVADDEDTEVETDTLWVEPLGTNFEPGKKWRFKAPGLRFSATIDDRDFMAQVMGGDVAIKPGDRMRVDLETTKFPDSRRPLRKIVRVQKHVPREKRGELQFD